MSADWVRITNDNRVVYWDGFAKGVGQRRFPRHKSRQEAEEFMRQLLASAKRSEGLRVRHGTTWRDLCQLWVNENDGLLEEGTFRRRLSSINAWIVPHVGDVKVHDTDLATLLKVADALLVAQIGVDNFDSTLQAMNQIASWAEERNVLPADPFGSDRRRQRAVRKLRARAKSSSQHSRKRQGGRIAIYQVPTWDDVVRFSEAVAAYVTSRTGSADMGKQYGRAIRIAAGGGFRFCELLGLTVDKVDLEAGLVTVDQQLDRYKKWINGAPMPTREPKYKLHRQVAVWAKIRQDLEEAVEDATDGVLFPPFAGQTWWAEAWGAVVDAARSSSGIEWTMHDLRHHYGSYSITPREAGGFGRPAVEVQQSLGHRDLSVTLNTYTHNIRPTKGWIE